MTNKEILEKLQSRRKVSAFARFLKMSPAGVYMLLKSDKKQHRQFYNYIEFVKKEFENGN